MSRLISKLLCPVAYAARALLVVAGCTALIVCGSIAVTAGGIAVAVYLLMTVSTDRKLL
jgi:hypothetical protein